MPVSPELIKEFDLLVNTYEIAGEGSRFKFKFNQDTHYKELLLALRSLRDSIIASSEELNDRSIINFLAPSAILLAQTDPAFLNCLSLFLNKYQAKTQRQPSMLDELHLFLDPEQQGFNFGQAFETQLANERKMHKSEIETFQREVARFTRENAELKTTVQKLERESDELKQLKIKFQQLQAANEQLHKSGVAFKSLDDILAPSICSETSTTTLTKPTQQATFLPPPPPPPPPPQLPQCVAENVISPKAASSNKATSVRTSANQLQTPVGLFDDLNARLKEIQRKKVERAEGKEEKAPNTESNAPPKLSMTNQQHTLWGSIQQRLEQERFHETLAARKVAMNGKDDEDDDNCSWSSDDDNEETTVSPTSH